MSTKPRLNDKEVTQLSSDNLSLSGTTRFLGDLFIKNVQINISGATNGQALIFEDNKLKPGIIDIDLSNYSGETINLSANTINLKGEVKTDLLLYNSDNSDEIKSIDNALPDVRTVKKILNENITGETSNSIKNKLESLSGDTRLDASAIKNLPEFSGETSTSILSKIGDGNKIDPSYIIGSVIEGVYINNTSFQVSGETITPTQKTLYVSTDNETVYRWSGSVFIPILNSVEMDFIPTTFDGSSLKLDKNRDYGQMQISTTLNIPFDLQGAKTGKQGIFRIVGDGNSSHVPTIYNGYKGRDDEFDSTENMENTLAWIFDGNDAIWGWIKKKLLVVGNNNAPTVSNVYISGLGYVGAVLTAQYLYSDAENDLEGATSFRWLVSDSQNGAYSQINGATNSSFTVTSAQLNKFIKVEVTPRALTGTLVGSPVTSPATSQIQAEPANQAPTAINVNITGNGSIGEVLTGNYTYQDNESDLQGISTFRWLIADTLEGTYTPINGATSNQFTLTNNEATKYIKFEVTPVAQTGTLIGGAVQSNPIYISEYSAEYQSVYDKFTTKPSSTIATAQNNFVVSLKNAGIWTKLDKLFVWAAHTNDNGEALLNWINPNQSAIGVNSPSFSAKNGFSGNGTNSYIDLNFYPAGLTKYTQNSATVGVYIKNNRTSNALQVATGAFTSTLFVNITPLYNNLAYVRVNNSLQQTISNAGTQGMWVATHNGTTLSGYKNKVKSSFTVATNGVPSINAYALGGNNNNALYGASTDQQSLNFWGSLLIDSEVNAITDAFATYLTAIA